MARLFACPNCSKRGIGVCLQAPGGYVCKYCGWECDLDNKYKMRVLFAARRMAPHDREQLLLISNEAWAWLTQTGRALGYIRAVSNAHGMQHFIDALSRLTYYDARSAYMQTTDQWYIGIEAMRMRRVELHANTGTALRALADAHGIAPYKQQRPVLDGHRSYIKEGPQFYSDGAYAAAVLEAIGIRWLRPVADVPAAPANLYRGPSRAAINARKRARN